MNSKLESVIEDEVCTELKSAGIHALNGVLGNVTKLLNPYLAPAPAPLNPDSVLKELLPDAKERAKLLNIQTHWAFRFLNDVFSEIFGKRDDQGLLGINEFVDGVTSGGNVSLQINAILLNSTNALTTGKITLTNLVITGLDTFTEADLYVMFSNLGESVFENIMRQCVTVSKASVFENINLLKDTTLECYDILNSRFALEHKQVRCNGTSSCQHCNCVEQIRI